MLSTAVEQWSRLPGLLPPAYLFQLTHGDSVVIPVHRFLGTNQASNIKKQTATKGQLHFDAPLQNSIKVSNPQHLTKAVQGAQIRLEVKVFEAGTLLRRQIERQVRTVAMHRMQINQGVSDALQVRLAKPAANIHIPSHQRGPVGNSSKPAD